MTKPIITQATRFFVVTTPAKNFVIWDICFETTLAGLELQFKGGLDPREIVGIFTDESAALTEASRLQADLEEL